jgi:hypothetical protein
MTTQKSKKDEQHRLHQNNLLNMDALHVTVNFGRI